MRSDARNTRRRRVPLEELPNHLLAQTDALHFAGAVHRAEYKSVSDTSRGSPRIYRHLYPRWHWYRPHAAMLANEVHNAPSSVALLDVGDCERSHLGPPEPAAQEHRQGRPVAQALGRGGIRGVQQLLGLLDGQPVPQADPLGCDPLNPRNPIGEFGRQETVIGRIHRQFAHRRNPDVDGNGAKAAALQRDAPGAHRRLRESGPGFAPEPLEEFVEPEIVNTAGDWRGDAIQHQALQSLPMGSLRKKNQISHLGPLNGQYR